MATRSKPKILIVGIGNMGQALVRGLGQRPDLWKDSELVLHDVHHEALQNFVQRARADNASLPLLTLAEIAKRSVAYLVLCVKPQDLASTVELRDYLGKDAMILSILAGCPMATVAGAFGFEGPLVRGMPNIAANAAAAATALSANSACQAEHKLLAQRLFEAVGEVVWVKESLLDAVTGLSGSGPAYIYLVIEALCDGGVKMGLPRAVALQLATQTVLGSALLVKASGAHPAILREQVTTPGGTTIHALHALEERGLRAMLIQAVEIATKRAEALSAAVPYAKKNAK